MGAHTTTINDKHHCSCFYPHWQVLNSASTARPINLDWLYFMQALNAGGDYEANIFLIIALVKNHTAALVACARSTRNWK